MRCDRILSPALKLIRGWSSASILGDGISGISSEFKLQLAFGISNLKVEL